MELAQTVGHTTLFNAMQLVTFFFERARKPGRHSFCVSLQLETHITHRIAINARVCVCVCSIKIYCSVVRFSFLLLLCSDSNTRHCFTFALLYILFIVCLN